jgi:hypothetical protein
MRFFKNSCGSKAKSNSPNYAATGCGFYLRLRQFLVVGFSLFRPELLLRGPSLRRKCLARARGGRLNGAYGNDVCLRVKGPNDFYLQPCPLFCKSLPVQLVDLVQILQYESSAALIYAVPGAALVFTSGFISIISLCDWLRE